MYITWPDAKEHLDEKGLGRIETTKLQELCEIAETRFDERLRIRMAVPIVESDSPQAFDIAKKVTSLWAAATYWREAPSAQGREDYVWFSRHLEKIAEDLISTLERPWLGADAKEAEDPLVHVPRDGLTTATATAAIFKRANVAPGGTHW